MRPSPSPPRSFSPRLPASRATRTSTVLNHTIPPFYACYLLRSFHPKRGGTYIGSTPDPPRRFSQHNGHIKGGAFQTKLARPWEMELIVYGFLTKLQALQFEWAWQNPHQSRLLHTAPPPPPPPPPDDDAATKKKKKEKPPAAPKPIAQFPHKVISNRALSRVQVLQFMLTVAPWRSFDLSVLCFSDDAKEWWDEARRVGPVMRTEAGLRKWEKLRVEEGTEGEDPWGERGERLERVKVEVRREGVDGKRLVRMGERREGEELGRIRVDDADFFEPHWEKWTALAAKEEEMKCGICRETVDTTDHLSFLLCTSSSATSTSPATTTPCTALFHLPCLSSHFLSAPSSSSSLAAPSAAPSAALPAARAPPLLPTHGTCPSCDTPLHWSELVRGAYRRKEEGQGTRKQRRYELGTRQAKAGKEVEKGEKKTSGRKVKAKTTAKAKAKAKGKGKAKAVASGEESEERFDFNDEDGDSDDTLASRADSVTLSGDAESDEERSWAQHDAAQGALEEVSEQEEDEPPMVKAMKKKKAAAAKSTTPARKRRSPLKASEPSITSTLSSTKSSLVTASKTKVSRAAAPKETAAPRSPKKTTTTRSPRRRPAAVAAEDDSDDLPPPSTLGIGLKKKRATKKRPEAAYIELSD
ncbi:hypothetical protein JCM1840_007108 [Sporobolomyces johnsonii]